MRSRRSRVALALLVLLSGWLLAQPFRNEAPVEKARAAKPAAPEASPSTEPASLPPLPTTSLGGRSAPGPAGSQMLGAVPAAAPLSPIPMAAEYAPDEVGKPQPPARPRRRHRIVDGDTLAMLALRYLGSRDRAEELFAANRNVLDDPHLLPIDVWLQIPPREPPADSSTSHRRSTAAALPVSTPAAQVRRDTPSRPGEDTGGESDAPMISPQESDDPAANPESPWRRVSPQRRLSAQGSS